VVLAAMKRANIVAVQESQAEVDEGEIKE